MLRLCIYLAVVMLAACQAQSPSISPTEHESALPPAQPTMTDMPVIASQTTISLVLSNTATLPATANAEPTPTPKAAEPALFIHYQEYAQIEILGPETCRVLIDVMEPAHLSAPVAASDILLTTHAHFDHINLAFADGFPGEELRIRAGMIERPGCKITGIASAHNAGDAFFQSGGSNYIFLIEAAGLRIAHFGDIGQDRFTELQLEQLGQLDVAIIQLANRFSDMNAQNEKAFRLIDQLQPRLIVPTHLDASTLALAVERFDSWYLLNSALELRAHLQIDRPNLILLGGHAVEFGTPLGLTLWSTP